MLDVSRGVSGRVNARAWGRPAARVEELVHATFKRYGALALAAMMAAMTRMSQAMDAVPMTEDTDRDFAAMMMIPHHAAAIAQVELAHDKDPAMRKMARAIVTAQRSESKTMEAWLARHDRH